MPKPSKRLFMMAKDLASAMRAVAKGDSSLLSGFKLADEVKMPIVMRNPVISNHPMADSIKILSVEVPRKSLAFERGVTDDITKGSAIETLEQINANKKISLFPNVDRRQHSAEGFMSTELFKDLAKQGKIKIHKNKPIKVEVPSELPTDSSLLPSSFREYTQKSVNDMHLTRRARDVLNTLDEINIADIKKLTPVQKVIKEAWAPHKDYSGYLEGVVKEDTKYGDLLPKITSTVAQSIRNVSEKMLPISEPRKRGVNANLTYRRMFKGPKDGKNK